MDERIPAQPPRALIAPACARVHLAGDVEHPAALTVADLRALPQRTVQARYVCGRRGEQPHTYTGPELLEVLLAAGPRFHPVIGKDRVRFLVVVTGRDGHLAVLSWGEIDPRYSGSAVLMATSVDDRPLDTHGPQLVVPGDTAGGRYVSQITSIWTGPATTLTDI
ncbi:molybdopterin-dependent oxidoreductase [Actinomadura rugatobispora]|uniref:Molybdopterin-dependent oxidoreductase n=1 Tax=Actinomadura rugatobispora TaxID=1994 RepID=A0ABW1A0L1_9ACTN|nr:hypothetical protein GCM10010200_090590 [Actinomadura rugatobispora]